MGKLEQVNGYVSMTLDKLLGIRGDLVRTDETWDSSDFVKLCEALRLWTRRNPLDSQPKEKYSDATNRRKDGSSKFFNARGRDIKQSCVYCDNVSHKSGECTSLLRWTNESRYWARRACVSTVLTLVIKQLSAPAKESAKIVNVDIILPFVISQRKAKSRKPF